MGLKCEIFIPYCGYADDIEVVNGVYEKDGEYAKALMEEYAKGGAIVDLFNGVPLKDDMGSTYVFGQDADVKEEKVHYVSCPCVVSEDGDHYVIDKLIDAFVKGETFIEQFLFDLESCDEDFISELALWENESYRIWDLEGRFGEQWSWSNLPIRDLKIHFKNKGGEDVAAMLEGCRIMSGEKDKIIIFINKVVLIDD